jgi:hypothetical protein
MEQRYFSDFFHIAPPLIERHGAYNVCLLTDLPLFIDPFLLFNSKKDSYRQLHEGIIRYLMFLKDRALDRSLPVGLLRAWFVFSEVHQNWLGYTQVGNRGSGLGLGFARALHQNLGTIFHNFGREQVARGTHLEKLCLINSGVGRDNISDFTTNLIKEYLLEYTQAFTVANVAKKHRRPFQVPRVAFDYATESWRNGTYILPVHPMPSGRDDYVLLTPKDLLTKDETWINRPDLFHDFDSITLSIPNEALRLQVDNYFRKRLSKKPTKEEIAASIDATIRQFPELLDHYIRYKEDNGERAVSLSKEKVRASQQLYVQNVLELAALLRHETQFYAVVGATYDDARQRALFLKDVIENKGGHRLFYDGKSPIRRESDLHILFRLTWFQSFSDVTREANDGRGPVDFKVSRGSGDKSLVEFKLASNSHLERNLSRQGQIYEAASDAKRTIKVIFYFSEAENRRVTAILRRLRIGGHEDIVLVDARSDNKPSGSRA